MTLKTHPGPFQLRTSQGPSTPGPLQTTPSDVLSCTSTGTQNPVSDPDPSHPAADSPILFSLKLAEPKLHCAPRPSATPLQPRSPGRLVPTPWSHETLRPSPPSPPRTKVKTPCCGHPHPRWRSSARILGPCCKPGKLRHQRSTPCPAEMLLRVGGVSTEPYTPTHEALKTPHGISQPKPTAL